MGEIYNMVQAYVTVDRIPTAHLSSEMATTAQVKSVPLSKLLPGQSDKILLQTELKIIIQHIICTYMEQFANADVCREILHPYSKESRQKSKFVPLGIIWKDENITSEMIEIMEEDHKYVAKDSKGDPVTLPLFCDGLSCERGYLAKKSRTNGRDNWHKLKGLLPSIQEWHLRQLTIRDVFDELIKGIQKEWLVLYFRQKIYMDSGK